jgi:amino acid adenylation domain-containing protein
MKELLKDISENNILLDVVDGDLKVFSDQANPNPELIAKIRENKNDLLEFLQSNKQTGHGDPMDIGIPATSAAASYPLSSAQHRLWLLSQSEQANIAYNLREIYSFDGDFRPAALEDAFNILVERHEILRTVFAEDEKGNVRQFISPLEKISFKMAHYDLTSDDDQDETLRRSLYAESIGAFDLAAGPLVRASIYRLARNRWVFSYTMHHIISDAWSMSILINELLLLYNANVKGEANPLPALKTQYKDYAAWQVARLSGETFKADHDYWTRQLEGELPILNFPVDKVRPAVKTYNGSAISQTISSSLSKGIKELGREQGATLFMGLLAAVNALLFRYTNQEDIIVGTPIASRGDEDLENQLGFYVNTLALRTRFNGEDSYKGLLEKTKEVTLGAYAHMEYPFDELVEALHLKTDKGRNSLFDVMVTLQSTGISHVNKETGPEGIKVRRHEETEHMVSKFDLSFSFCEIGDALQLDIEYNSDIYFKGTVKRLASHFQQLLAGIIKTPSAPIWQLGYLTKEEELQLTVAFNDTKADYSGDRTITGLLEQQVRKTPESVAIVSGEAGLTYRELNEESNRLAHYLRTKYNIGQGDLAGVKLDRNEWMIISMIAVLKSGGAYVPIDPEYPQDRIDYMMKDSGCKVVIDQEELEKFRHERGQYSGSDGESTVKPDDLAYMIYTSGTTGKPKGVLIGHRNAYAFIRWCQNEFGQSDFDTVLGVTSICFDLSIFEIFYTLSSGKKLRVLPDALSIPQYLNNGERILLNTVPSVVGALLEVKTDFTAVKVLNMAGEPIPRKYLLSLDSEKTEIRNLYGPTEATTYSTVYRIKSDQKILIGRPITNTEVYILDEHQHLQPLNVIGEICISGEGVAQGYLNQPEQTAEKFIANPFKEGSRLYRTGDLGRWLPDGNIEFIGRKDNQVKIRGYRIELGEIESALLAHPDIQSAVVITRPNPDGNIELVAYLEAPASLITVDLRGILGKTLPAYMLPSYYIRMNKFPLTPTGKIDKKNLPEPDSKDIQTSANYVAARNEIDEKLIQMWQELLDIGRVGIKDDFFESGGHSIKLMKLMSMIHKEFNVRFKLGELFNKTTIEVISDDISKRQLIDSTKEIK